MKQKKTNKQERKSGLQMSDDMKRKYAELLATALDSMECEDWKKPWVAPHNGKPCNLYYRSKPYRKSNAFWLTMLMQLNGWETPYFLMKSQMKNEDGKLKYSGLTANSRLVLDEDGMPKMTDKGTPEIEVERRFPVVLWRPYRRDKDGNKVTDEEWDALTDEEKKDCKVSFYQKWYLVYNLDQTNFKELYPEDYKKMTSLPEHDYKEGTRDEVLEKMLQGEWRCPIRFGGNRAFFAPSEDRIQLPKREAFMGDTVFYQTAIHEMAHSTAPDVKRELTGMFGDEEYALEEFVAELSSACVCSMLGIGKLLDENHVAYVQNWRRALKTQKDAIPVVIDHVQKATNFILTRYEEVAKAMEQEPLAIAA